MGTEVIDQGRLKKLRRRCETDDPQFKGMKKLKVRGRDLGKLPYEIYHIADLEVLDLSPERESCINYRLTEIHPAVGRLINLRVLMLDTNDIGELPQEIGLLSSLERFTLSNNQLVALPEGFTSLHNLRSLYLANNQFERFPRQVCELKQLQFLDLCDNDLVEVPETLGRMEGLETLLLYNNRIKELPDDFCKLRLLRCLWLGDNKLKTLPKDFGELSLLDWGGMTHTSSCSVDGNPLTHPPIEVCKRGVKHIAHYFSNTSSTRKD